MLSKIYYTLKSFQGKTFSGNYILVRVPRKGYFSVKVPMVDTTLKCICKLHRRDKRGLLASDPYT